jgi:ATP-binding cassette subfamily B (MDR/TAP) protein 1
LQIMVDGHDLKSLQLNWWRSQIALVSQEPALFNDTIYGNIAMAKPGATREEVIAAAIAANADSFISRMPDGYNTNVGDKGTQMSGGQRQRIAIARAILRNPKVLLLDEATSALDNQSEKLVQESLDTLMAGRTTIIVAHRLSTVMNADIIAVVRKGQVVDQGTHAELLKRGGFYASLVAKQSLVAEDTEQTEEDVPVTKQAKPTLRQSVLTRMSVRLSVIPQDIMNKLKRAPETESAEEGLPFKRLVNLNKPEWKQGIVGMLSSAALGLQMPAFALALAGIVGVFFEPTPEAIRDGGQKWACIYVAIGVGCWIFGMLQGWSFGVMGQNLAVRIKVLFLKSTLRQNIGWHDEPENATGKLMTRLSSDTMSIRGAVGDQVGVVVQNVSTVIAAFVIAFTSSWSLTLVVGSLLPLMSGAQFVQTLMLTGQFTKVSSSSTDASMTFGNSLT